MTEQKTAFGVDEEEATAPHIMDRFGQNVAVVGTQWGDEGKGKLVDAIAGNFHYVCRSTGGANAGHTIVVEGKKYIFHLLPSGLLHDGTTAVIGNGTVIHLQSIWKEIQTLTEAGLDIAGRVVFAENAHVLLECHKLIDAEQERRKGDDKIGTTCRGIGPCYSDKIARRGIRLVDLKNTETAKKKVQKLCKTHSELWGMDIDWEHEWAALEPYIDKILPLVKDVPEMLYEAYSNGYRLLFEGAQAHHLDIDHGTYPYVTSSNVSVGGVCTGLGVPPREIDTVVGIAKAYTTRVGGGPFPTELLGDTGEKIRQQGHEFGSTTGRPRRCGWFDAPVVRRAVRLNGIDEINLTKLDVLSGVGPLQVCIGEDETGQPVYETMAGWTEDVTKTTEYDALPEAAKAYVERLEVLIEAPITSIGVGPGREALILKPLAHEIHG